MATLHHLVSVYLTITCYSWNTKALPQNSSCEHGENCARNTDVPGICPPGYYCSEDGGKIHPCPAGTFSPGGELGASIHCIDCPVNFFNHIIGQKACFPCGSEAVQPEEGQVTCVCRGQGQVFQPSDSRCPCAPGNQLIGDTNNCVPIVYDICRDGTVRNQEGQCLNKKEWEDYCSNQVCILPKYYQGYDRVLGLCICQAEDLDDICNAACRRKRKQNLQITCVDETLKLHATNSTGEQALFSADDIFGSVAIEHSMAKLICSSSTKNVIKSVYVVMSTGQGFWGIYDANSQFIKHFFEGQGSLPLANMSGEERMSPSNLIPGILNPTTCIHMNDFIMFVASKHNYPVYDVNNLYNTNPEFDWGKFRTLEEEIWLSQRPWFFFLYQFQEPGVYVFKLNSNHYKKMYVRVMLTGGQCYEEGTFFPTAPRHVIRNGIAKMPRLLLKPDWPAITGILTGLSLILITCIFLIVWFQDLGWKQKVASIPKFRKQQLKFNFDNYSSKGSAVSTVKKLHSKMRIKGHIDKKWDEADKKKCYRYLEDDEFWDYEQQIDMECFNTQIFYDILLKQSLMITAKHGQLKEEVKTYYEKLAYEVSTLKDIFVKCLSITWKPKRYNSSVMESYTRKKKEAELEITKRKTLAAEFEDILNRQQIALQQNMKSLEDHCVLFNGALRECLRLLKVLETRTTGRESGTKLSINNFQKLMSQFEEACNRMYTAVMKESDRLKAWGVLGEGTGANLVNKDRTRALTKRDIIALDGSVRECDIVRVNSIHGLLTPDSHSVMLLSTHYLMPVPSDYFVHKKTGKVLPIAGNVVYDPVTSQLITSVDSAFRKIWKSEAPVFPYVPYPMCPNTGLPVHCNLPIIHHHRKHEGLTIMTDLVSRLEVPILAVTRHPQTRQWMTLGGTYIHPLTNMVSPIEIGGPMIDTKTGKVCPILGVGLDNDTGQVTPIGGLVSASGVISVLGDHFCEPLSGKKVRIHGAVLHEGKVMPHAGGYQALLESNLLMAQINVMDALKAHKDLIPDDEPLTKEDLDQAHSILSEAVENMKKSTAIKQQYLIYRLYNVSCQQKMAADFRSHGGNLGMIIYPKTELWIPAVVGMEIPDPGPSDLMVPVLGVEYDFIKGHLIPLAGTMEDSDGKGLIPIKIGGRTIDPITGDSGPVVGARTCPLTGVVIPVVQSWGLPRGDDYYLLEGLEKEMKTRERFWQNQKIKEEQLLKELSNLVTFILGFTREGQISKFRLKDKIESLEETCQSIEASSLCEIQRRTHKNLQSLSIKISQVPFISENTEEKEQQFLFSLVVRKTMEKLSHFTDKVEQESERMQTQLREWEKSREGPSEKIIKAKQTMVIQSIVDEFEEHITKRLSGVESAYSRLEYLREYTKLQGLQAKSVLLGTTPQYTNPLLSHWNSGKEIRDLSQSLTPMLKYLIQLVEENKNFVLLSQTQIPTSGYSSRSTLKASAANSDTFQVKPNTEKLPSQIPWFNNAEMIYGHWGYLFRFLTEKQASELVHLERLLVTEEINKIWNFFETYRLSVNGNVSENLLKVVSSCKNNDKELESDQCVDVYFEWYRLLDDLTEVHTTALQALLQKHVDEVKSMALHPGTVIPEHYFNRDVRASIEQLAADMQTVYDRHGDTTQDAQGMSSYDAKLCTEDKHTQTPLLRQVAAKVVKQELLTQIHMYNILDEYSKLQVESCVGEVKEVLHALHYEAYSGKEAAKEAANSMEESQVEKLLDFFRTSYKKEQLQHSQWSLSEMQSQLNEEHRALTEGLLQAKDTLLFEELSNSESRSYMEHVVCCVLSRRHLRQTIILLQESFKTPKHDPHKLSGRWTESGDDIVTGHCQEDILSLLNDETEARLLLVELQCVIKRIQMRELYLEELANSLKEYCSDKVHILTCVEEAHYLAQELHTFKEQKLKRLKEELKEFCVFARVEEKASSLGKVEEKTLLKSFQEKQSELEQIHRKQISEERLKLQDQLERGELNGFFKQKLIREHDETVAFLEKTLQLNLESLTTKLEEEMKNKQNEESHIPLEHAGLKNNDQNILSLLEESVSIFQQAEQIVASRITLLGPQVFSFIFSPDGDAAKTIESSPVLTLLKEVDGQMRAIAQNAGIIHGNNESAKDKTHIFRDTLDLQLICKSDLVKVNEEELTAIEIVVYQYGIYVLDLLKTHFSVGELQLHIASSLPENNHRGNAFSQSFFYQKSEDKLYISREYLKSVGSLILLIVHCISHIACGDLNDDTSAFFLRIFYEGLKICFSDGFLSRLQMSPSSQDTKSNSKTEGKTEKRTHFIGNESKLKPHRGMSVFKEPLNKTGEMLCQHKTEILLKNKLSARKREFFNQSLKEGTSNPGNGPSFDEGISPAHLEEIEDDLNFQLIKVLEKEIEHGSSLNNEDEMCCYSHMISLEKECLRKKIKSFEKMIDKQNRPV